MQAAKQGIEKKEKIELEQELREEKSFLADGIGVCGGPLDVQNIADPPSSSFHIGCGC
jgi:hypothetical protein